LKDALRRQSVDRTVAKETIRFLGQPMGRALHKKLKDAHQEWSASRDDSALLDAVSALAAEFSKNRPTTTQAKGALGREDLTLICFEYITG
jgi:hypothetical protein